MEYTNGLKVGQKENQSNENKDGDLLGIVIGVTKPGYITFEGKEPVGLGEYITIINNQNKSILGVFGEQRR